MYGNIWCVCVCMCNLVRFGQFSISGTENRTKPNWFFQEKKNKIFSFKPIFFFSVQLCDKFRFGLVIKHLYPLLLRLVTF